MGVVDKLLPSACTFDLRTLFESNERNLTVSVYSWSPENPILEVSGARYDERLK
jgi:hypothetical protein